MTVSRDVRQPEAEAVGALNRKIEFERRAYIRAAAEKSNSDKEQYAPRNSTRLTH